MKPMEQVEGQHATPILKVLEKDLGASQQTLAILAGSGARDAETVRSLLKSFPSLGKSGLIETELVSYAVNSHLPAGYTAESAPGSDDEIMPSPFGAAIPDDSVWPLGAVADLPLPAGATGSAMDTMPVRLEHPSFLLPYPCRDWHIKHQGNRETCVSFATNALREHLACELGVPGSEPLSEQFLHWAIKTTTGDPLRDVEISYVKFALDALSGIGVCPTSLCLYNPQPISGNPSQHGTPHEPTHAASAAAPLWTHAPATHQFTHRQYSGKAKLLLDVLKLGRPVAVSLSVFTDPISGANNWQTDSGVRHGFVFNPPVGTQAAGGHAVAIVGFQADDEEPLGGHFVFRNSWGRGWGRDLPAARYHGPAPGYGQVSASYVDRYLNEMGYFPRI